MRSATSRRGGCCHPSHRASLWAVLPYLPTYLPGYLPTYYLLTYYRHTYPPTTYLGAGEFLIEGSLGAGLVLAARAHGVHGAREHLHALVDEASQPVEAARRLHLERHDVRDAG